MYCIVEQRVLPSLTEEERELLLTQAHPDPLVNEVGGPGGLSIEIC